MGICASCLGSRNKDVFDEEEESPLYIDDGNNIHYGSFNDPHIHDDPVESQREIEALQRVVARTSDNMVDIFEVTPQSNRLHHHVPTYYTYAGQDARMARYQHLLSKLSDDDDDHTGAHASTDWLAIEDDTTTTNAHRGGVCYHKKTESEAKIDDGALVGTFADAAAA